MNEQIRKVKLPDDYPPEEGCYLRGNDFSPVAVAVILKWKREEIPKSIEQLVRGLLKKKLSVVKLHGGLQILPMLRRIKKNMKH